jgi:hypothetical protein
MKKELQIDTLKSVGVTQIIPEEWEDWIWTSLSEGAPFTFGDNNHSLVDAMSFKDHLKDTLSCHYDDTELQDTIVEHKQSILDILDYLEANQIFVDMEQ